MLIILFTCHNLCLYYFLCDNRRLYYYFLKLLLFNAIDFTFDQTSCLQNRPCL